MNALTFDKWTNSIHYIPSTAVHIRLWNRNSLCTFVSILKPSAPLPATILLLTFSATHSLCYFVNDIMFGAADPVTYFCRKRELDRSSIRQKGRERERVRVRGWGRWWKESAQHSINSAVSRDAEWKRKRGGGRTGEAREEGEALEWDEGLRGGDVKNRKKEKRSAVTDAEIAED